MNRKKAVSPVVSTVLLILIVIVLAAIIFVWSRSFIKEAITKNIGGTDKSVDQVCSSELNLKSFVNPDGSFGFTNNGNVPIYGFSLKLVDKTGGNSNVVNDYNNQSVNPGKSITVNSYNYNNYYKVEIIPILLGKSSGGNQQYPCPETNAVVV